MSEIAQINLILEQVGKHWGLESFHYSDDRPTTLVFNDNLTLHFKQSACKKNLVIFASLGQAFSESDSSVVRCTKLHALLRANLLWRDTAGATLGMRASGAVILAQQWPSEGLSSQHLCALVDVFVGRAESIQTSILRAEPLAENQSWQGDIGWDAIKV